MIINRKNYPRLFEAMFMVENAYQPIDKKKIFGYEVHELDDDADTPPITEDILKKLNLVCYILSEQQLKLICNGPEGGTTDEYGFDEIIKEICKENKNVDEEQLMNLDEFLGGFYTNGWETLLIKGE